MRIILAVLAAVLFGLLVSRAWDHERSQHGNPLFPDCVAEAAYTHPMNDRWLELRNAIALCDGNGVENTR